MPDQLILLNATSELVKQGDTSEVAGILSDLSDGGRGRTSVAIGIYGYEDDPREIYQIPEARQWWSVLDQQFPHLFYFLTPHMDQRTLYALCLLPSQMEQGQPTIDSNYLFNFIVERLDSVGSFCRQIGEDPSRLAEEIAQQFGFEIDAPLFYSQLAEIKKKQSQHQIDAALQFMDNEVEKTLNELQEGLNQKETRLICAKALCETEDARFIGPVLDAIKQMNWSEAEEIAEFLPLFGESIVPHLIQIAQKGKKSATAAAMRGLGLVGGKTAANALIERLIALPSKSEPTEALVSMGKSAVASLKPLLTHPKADVRAMAAFALGKIGDKSSLTVLEQIAANDRSEKVQGVAFHATTWIRGEALCNIDLRNFSSDVPIAPTPSS